MTGNLPETVERYSQSPVFDETTMPAKLLSNHDLKAGVWGKICVKKGTLEYVIPGQPDQIFTIEAGESMVLEPELVHFIRPIGEVRFQIEFFR